MVYAMRVHANAILVSLVSDVKKKHAQITATATGLVQREAVYVAMDILVLLATPKTVAT